MAITINYTDTDKNDKLIIIKEQINIKKFLNIISKNNNQQQGQKLQENIISQLIKSNLNQDIFFVNYKNNQFFNTQYKTLDNNPIQYFYKIDESTNNITVKPAYLEKYLPFKLLANILQYSHSMLEHDYSKEEQQKYVKKHITPYLLDGSIKKKDLIQFIKLESSFYNLDNTNSSVNNLAACNAIDLIDIAFAKKFTLFTSLASTAVDKVETTLEREMKKLQSKHISSRISTFNIMATKKIMNRDSTKLIGRGYF